MSFHESKITLESSKIAGHVSILFLFPHKVVVYLYSSLKQSQWCRGSSLSDKVHQSPADMYKKPGETAQLNCSHNIQSYDRILWYRQSENQQMQFLGYMLGGFEKFPVTKPDAASGTLTVKDLVAEDKGLYFCAVSEHSDTDSLNG
uniref:Ig-like domain-containing protein n=1 Tax=Myripristis murdjan TaxID=586833 RepID=A0A667YSY3_9TELE